MKAEAATLTIHFLEVSPLICDHSAGNGMKFGDHFCASGMSVAFAGVFVDRGRNAMNTFLKRAMLVFFAVLPALAFSAPIAYVHEMSGTATATVGGTTKPLSLGDTLEEGQTVKSGKEGFVTMRFADGQLVLLHPGSSFTVSKYKYSAQDTKSSNILFRLAVGAMRFVSGAIGKTNPQNFSLLTPTATIGIRGTDCVVISDAETTIVVCDSGTAIFDTSGGHSEVGPGQYSIARGNEKPSVPQVATDLVADYRTKVLNLMKKAMPPNTPPGDISKAADKIIQAAQTPSTEANQEAQDVVKDLPTTPSTSNGNTNTGGGGGSSMKRGSNS